MKSRERVLRAINFKESDRIPFDLGSTITSIHRISHGKLKEYLGFEGGNEIIIDSLQQIVAPDERILKQFEIDFRHVSLRPAVPWKEIGDGIYKDEWGIVFKVASGYCEIIEHPLANMNTVEDLDKYPWPDPLDERRFVGLEDQVKELYNHSDYAIMFGGFSESFVGMPCWLMGHEKFFMGLMLNPEFIEAVLDRLEQYYLPLAEESIKRVGSMIQVVKVADDLGTQTGTLISPEMYRDVIKPRHKKLYSKIKEYTDAKIFMHSCGAIRPLINDFIDNGVDILNPIQISATNMDPASLKEEFGDKLVFWGGGCDTQHVLPFGSVKDVEEEVKLRIKQLARGGGFIFTAVHNIQYDVPAENIMALYNTAKKYGTYPIS